MDEQRRGRGGLITAADLEELEAHRFELIVHVGNGTKYVGRKIVDYGIAPVVHYMGSFMPVNLAYPFITQTAAAHELPNRSWLGFLIHIAGFLHKPGEMATGRMRFANVPVPGYHRPGRETRLRGRAREIALAMTEPRSLIRSQIVQVREAREGNGDDDPGEEALFQRVGTPLPPVVQQIHPGAWAIRFSILDFPFVWFTIMYLCTDAIATFAPLTLGYAMGGAGNGTDMAMANMTDMAVAQAFPPAFFANVIIRGIIGGFASAIFTNATSVLMRKLVRKLRTRHLRRQIAARQGVLGQQGGEAGGEDPILMDLQADLAYFMNELDPRPNPPMARGSFACSAYAGLFTNLNNTTDAVARAASLGTLVWYISGEGPAAIVAAMTANGYSREHALYAARAFGDMALIVFGWVGKGVIHSGLNLLVFAADRSIWGIKQGVLCCFKSTRQCMARCGEALVDAAGSETEYAVFSRNQVSFLRRAAKHGISNPENFEECEITPDDLIEENPALAEAEKANLKFIITSCAIQLKAHPSDLEDEDFQTAKAAAFDALHGMINEPMLEAAILAFFAREAKRELV